MLRTITLCMLFVFNMNSFMAQNNNLILFTENGEKFQVILNGILQNQNPETNVRLTGLPAPNYKCRVMFSDKALGYLDFNVFFQESGEELTMAVKQNKKGEYVTRYVSSIPVATAPPAPGGQTVYVYTEKAAPVESVTTTVSHSSTTQQSGNSPSGENINLQMGVSMNENGGNINIQASGMEIDGDINATTTTTTTTHTVTKTTTTSKMPPDSPTEEKIIYIQGYNGPVGCPHPMSPADFNSMKQTISSKDFESTRLSIAKQVLQKNCLITDQVREVMSLFDFENTRLEYAKFAYDYTYDTGNYFKVNDAFEFESSVEDLNKYINTKN